uniref:Uncharacterized protein n=1 Tax=Proboscia inermis TaxID=420281 RepID=A0A7S0GKP7_9STRA
MVVRNKVIFLPLLLLTAFAVFSYLHNHKNDDISRSHDVTTSSSDTAFESDGIGRSRRRLQLGSLRQEPLVQRPSQSQVIDDSSEIKMLPRKLSRQLNELTNFEDDMCEQLRQDDSGRSLSLTKDFGDPRNVEFKAHTYRRKPEGLRLLMMGDTVTRYMYLSLTYYLSHGTWYSENNSPGKSCYLVCETTFANWHHFFKMTSSMLGPLAHENCDFV